MQLRCSRLWTDLKSVNLLQQLLFSMLWMKHFWWYVTAAVNLLAVLECCCSASTFLRHKQHSNTCYSASQETNQNRKTLHSENILTTYNILRFHSCCILSKWTNILTAHNCKITDYVTIKGPWVTRSIFWPPKVPPSFWDFGTNRWLIFFSFTFWNLAFQNWVFTKK